MSRRISIVCLVAGLCPPAQAQTLADGIGSGLHIGLFLVLCHVLGALTSIRAVMDVRTPQGTIAWAVALNTMPYLSVPAYWVLGRRKFHGYITQRRDEMVKTLPAARQFADDLDRKGLHVAPAGPIGAVFQQFARPLFTTGNDAELLVNGEAMFRSIFAGIAEAREYVLVEFYIVRDDKIGNQFLDCLVAKAKQGVPVRLLYDEVGSKDLPRSYVERLKAGGVEVHPFNTRQGPSNRWQLNFRNHRKIVVVDGRTAWIGGINVGDEYLGHSAKFGPWRDTHVKVSGPVVAGIQFAFYEDWHWAAQELLELHWRSESAASGARRVAACVASSPADSLETCTLCFLQAIHSAQKRLWIASPYFVPDEQFISALQLAALRGVEVRILIPHKQDKPLLFYSACAFVPELERVGVRVMRHREGFMHQKVVLVDDDFATIGTANFDNRSFRLNFEITLAFADVDFAKQVERMLEDDFTGAKQVTTEEIVARGFWFRLLTRVARLMAPLQ